MSTFTVPVEPQAIESTTLYRELLTAFQERCAVIGYSTDAWAAENGVSTSKMGPWNLPIIDGGIVWQSLFWWATWQSLLETMAPAYCNSHDYPSGYAGLESMEMYTITTLKVAAGLVTDWRRIPEWGPVSGTYDTGSGLTTLSSDAGVFKDGHAGCGIIVGERVLTIASVLSTTQVTVTGDCHGSYRCFTILPQDWTNYSDPAYWYGAIQTGDLVGAWLLRDLQQVMLQMRWAPASPVGWLVPETEGVLINVSSDLSATVAAAEAQAEARYAAATPATGGTVPSCVAAITGMPTFPTGTASLVREYSYPQWRVHADVARDLDFYSKGVRPSGGFTQVFIPNGDFPAGYAEGDVFKWLTLPGVTGLAGSSGVPFGSLVQPTWPTWGGWAQTLGGYVLSTDGTGWAAGFKVVARYDVEGGFVIQS